MNAAMLVATELTVGYGTDAVVGGISLVVQPGESVALVGTNGSGKSTLLKTILGLIPPVAGSLEVLGGEPGTRPKRIAYLGQAHTARFVVPIRAIEVVRMGRFAELGLLGRTSDRDRQLVHEAMTHMEVTHLADQPLRSLSGGQQQRIYLAQVMAREADLLVLDEPTGGLDVAGRERYRELVEMALARGAAVVTATHDIGEASGCSQVLLVNRRIIAHGAPEDVLNTAMLLQTFGITLQGIQHDDHHDFVIGETPHGHDHGHDHSH